VEEVVVRRDGERRSGRLRRLRRPSATVATIRKPSHFTSATQPSPGGVSPLLASIGARQGGDTADSQPESGWKCPLTTGVVVGGTQWPSDGARWQWRQPVRRWSDRVVRGDESSASPASSAHPRRARHPRRVGSGWGRARRDRGRLPGDVGRSGTPPSGSSSPSRTTEPDWQSSWSPGRRTPTPWFLPSRWARRIRWW
jgi:hypothetical protein